MCKKVLSSVYLYYCLPKDLKKNRDQINYFCLEVFVCLLVLV